MGAPSDYRFGVVESYAAPAQAGALGARWTRITFEWNHIQPTGPGDWIEEPVPDGVLDTESAAGRELVGLITATPGWATDTSRGIGVPIGLYLPADSPENRWADFVRKLVSRHSGRVNHWIIWNEPDIWDTQFQSWGGSVEDFVQLLKVTYDVAHQANPNAVIHLPAVTHWWDANYGRDLFMRRLLRVLTADPTVQAHNYYFDAITLHIYFNPDTVYDLSRLYTNLLGEFGIWKPLWIVETNAAPSDDPAWPVPNPQFRITQEDQAAFIIQSMAMALAAGAQRVAVYKLADMVSDTANPEPFGLVRLDGSRRPAFTAYQTAVRYLSGFQSATLTRDAVTSVVEVTRDTGWTTVVWARGPEGIGVSIPAHSSASSATLVDWQGRERRVYADNGSFTVNLPGSACTHPAAPCLIGGAPLLLVEGAVSAPQPVAPVATQSPAPSVAVVPTATATATVMPTATNTPTHTPRPTSTRPPATATPLPPTVTATATRTPEPTSTAPPTPTVSVPIVSPTSTPPASPPPPGNAAAVTVAAVVVVAVLGALTLSRRFRKE